MSSNKWYFLSNKYPRIISFSVQILLVILGLAIVQWYQTRNLLKQQAAPLHLLSLDGISYDISHLPAKRTLIYFFAPWCTVCKFNFDNLKHLAAWRSDRQKFQLLAVALAYEDVAEIQEFLMSHQPLNFPVLKGTEEVREKWRISAFPTFYVLNEKKEIISSGVGYTTTLGLWWRSW